MVSSNSMASERIANETLPHFLCKIGCRTPSPTPTAPVRGPLFGYPPLTGFAIRVEFVFPCCYGDVRFQAMFSQTRHGPWHVIFGR